MNICAKFFLGKQKAETAKGMPLYSNGPSIIAKERFDMRVVEDFLWNLPLVSKTKNNYEKWKIYK